jgi:TonB family protein
LKPNKSQALPSQEKTQTLGSVERSTQISQEQEPSSASLTTQRDESRGDQTGGPSLEAAGGNPNDSSSFEDETIGEVMEPESRTEFMSTTGLSSRQRQVMLPGETASPESRKFEVIEVEETDEEQLGDSSVEISTPQLQEAVKSIIQNENTPDRVKTGDLLPIDSVDVPPIATKKINPKYPPAAYRQGLEETVVFRALISEFGNVLDVAFVDPTKTAPAFKKVCEEAVRQWRFTPAKKDGVNVKVWKTFSIAFKKNKTE